MNDYAPEFSRIINAERLSAAGLEERLEAKPAERAALAKRFDLINVPRLVALLVLQPERSGAIMVKGTIEADVVQRCIVTLEPLANHLDIHIAVTFVPENLQTTGQGALGMDMDEEDTEYYADHKIDLGELMAQHMGINLDPYPRKPDAVLPQTEFGVEHKKLHPFAPLADLIKKPPKSDKTDS